MNAMRIPRMLLLGSAVGALALRPSRTAQADTSFTNFSFAATGAPAVWTMADRLSDIVNVKDWGAKGDNSTDDKSAIQAAINYCITHGGGTVFFPEGSYKTSQPLVSRFQ
jgi:polygalacturonase